MKHTFDEVWRVERGKLDATCCDRFRTSDNVNQWVMLWWQIASGQFSPCVIDNLVNSVDEDTIDSLCEAIVHQTHDYICLNDPEKEIDFEKLSERLQQAFETILPEKSTFEE